MAKKKTALARRAKTGDARVLQSSASGNRATRLVCKRCGCDLIEALAKEQRAKARLIAAAPELLAACKLALMAFERNDAIDWSVLERAIAKAEGR